MKGEPEIQDHKKQQSLKEQLVNQLQASDNPLVLDQIKAVLDEEAVLDKINHIPLIQQLIKEKEKEDFKIRKQLTIEQSNKLSRYDAQAAGTMFYLGILSLLLIGALVTAVTEEDPSPLLLTLLPWLSGFTGLVYLLFAIDAGLLFYKANQSKQPRGAAQRDAAQMNKPEKRRRLLAILFPSSSNWLAQHYYRRIYLDSSLAVVQRKRRVVSGVKTTICSPDDRYCPADCSGTGY